MLTGFQTATGKNVAVSKSNNIVPLEDLESLRNKKDESAINFDNPLENNNFSDHEGRVATEFQTVNNNIKLSYGDLKKGQKLTQNINKQEDTQVNSSVKFQIGNKHFKMPQKTGQKRPLESMDPLNENSDSSTITTTVPMTASELLDHDPLQNKSFDSEQATKIRKVENKPFSSNYQPKQGYQGPVPKIEQFIKTGCPSIDKILGGGVRRGVITEFAGSKGTAKSQICFSLCITCQLPESQGGGGGMAVYIDTENRFSKTRLEAMSEKYKSELTEALKNSPHLQTDFLYNISVCNVTTVHQQFSALENLEKLAAQKKIALIIVDSLTALIREEFDEYKKILERQMNLATVVTNQMTIKSSDQNNTFKKQFNDSNSFIMSMTEYNERIKAKQQKEENNVNVDSTFNSDKTEDTNNDDNQSDKPQNIVTKSTSIPCGGLVMGRNILWRYIVSRNKTTGSRLIQRFYESPSQGNNDAICAFCVTRAGLEDDVDNKPVSINEESKKQNTNDDCNDGHAYSSIRNPPTLVLSGPVKPKTLSRNIVRSLHPHLLNK